MRAKPRQFASRCDVFISMLILSSLSVFASDNAGGIYNAVRHENVECVKTRLANDTNVVNFVVEKQWTMLHFAAGHGSPKGIEILKLLLASGANIEAKNHIGQTPLFSAVIHNNFEGTKLLIAHGAKVNLREANGFTPLHAAALNGYCEVASVLIKNKAAIKTRADGKTPLGLALDQQERYRVEGDVNAITRYQQVVNLLRATEATK